MNAGSQSPDGKIAQIAGTGSTASPPHPPGSTAAPSYTSLLTGLGSGHLPPRLESCWEQQANGPPGRLLLPGRLGANGRVPTSRPKKRAVLQNCRMLSCGSRDGGLRRRGRSVHASRPPSLIHSLHSGSATDPQPATEATRRMTATAPQRRRRWQAGTVLPLGGAVAAVVPTCAKGGQFRQANCRQRGLVYGKEAAGALRVTARRP